MEYNLTLLRNIRQTMLEDMEGLTLEQLNHIPAGFSNNIIWNIGHALVVQQLLCYSLSNIYCPVKKEILVAYKNGAVPTGNCSQEEVDYIKKWLIESVDVLEKDFKGGLFKTYKEYTVGFKTVLKSVEEAITFNNTHEGVHYGCMTAIKRML